MRWPLLIRRVQGQSMSPALEPGDLVLALGWLRNFSRGDVVIIRHDAIEKIKRISCIDSESIEILGDNHSASTDSRQFGKIPRSMVIGKVMWSYRNRRVAIHG